MNITRSTLLRAGLATAAAFATGLATSLPALAQGKKLVFATEAGYPPFNMAKPDGTIYGFEIDMLAEIAKRAGFEYEVIAQAWDGMIQGLIDGKYDAVIDCVTITEPRKEVVRFTLPYTADNSAFVVLTENGLQIPGTGTLLDLDDEAAAAPGIDAIVAALEGKMVGVQVSTTQSDFLDKYLAPRGITIRSYQNGADVFQDLLNGRLDAGLSADTNIAPFLEKNAGAAALSGPTLSGGVMGQGAAIVVQKDNAELADRIDAALKSMSDDGTLEKMSIQWFGMNVTSKL